MNQQSPLVSSSSHLATGNISSQMDSRDLRYQPISTASMVSVTSAGGHERIMHHPASMKPITGVAVSKSVPTTVVHSSVQMSTGEAAGVSTSVQSIRPMTPQEISVSSSSANPGPRESAMIQEMNDLVASLKIPLTSSQVSEISKMTALRMEGLLGGHGQVYHDDVYATQLTLLQFICSKLTEFGFSDVVPLLKEHIIQVFAFKKELATEITTSGKVMPSSVKLMTPRGRTAIFGTRLDAYCLADLLREAAVLHTSEVVSQFLKGITTDHNMVLFVSCIDRAVERIGFNPEINKPALYNFIYNRPSLKTTSVSSLHSSNSINSITSARLRRGVSPTSPYSATSAQAQLPTAVDRTSRTMHVTQSPQVIDARSPNMSAVVYVPETLPGSSYSSTHVKTYSQSQAFPTTVTVKVRSSEVVPAKTTEDSTLIGIATDLLANSRPSSTVSQTFASRHTSVEQGGSVQGTPSPTVSDDRAIEVSTQQEVSVETTTAATPVSVSGQITEVSRVVETSMMSTDAVESRMTSHQQVPGLGQAPEVVIARSVSHSSTSSSVRGKEALTQQVAALRGLATTTFRYDASRANVMDLDSSLRQSMASLIETLNGVILEIDDMKKHTAHRLDEVTHNLGEFAHQMHKRVDSLHTKHGRFHELSTQLSRDINELHSHTQRHSTGFNEITTSFQTIQDQHNHIAQSHEHIAQRHTHMETLHTDLQAKVEDLSRQLATINGDMQQVYIHIDERFSSQLGTHVSQQELTTLRQEIEEDRRVMRMYEEELSRFRSQVDELKVLLNNYNFKKWLEEAQSVRQQITEVRTEMDHFKHSTGNIHSSLNDHDSRIKHLEAHKPAASVPDLSNLHHTLSHHDSRITQLETRSVAPNGVSQNDYNNLRVDVSNHEHRIQQLETHKAAPGIHPNDLTSVHNSLSHYESRIAHLEAKGVTNQISSATPDLYNNHEQRIKHLESHNAVPAFVLEDIKRLNNGQAVHDQRIAALELHRDRLMKVSMNDIQTGTKEVQHLIGHTVGGPVINAGVEERLRLEIESLQRQIHELRSSIHSTTAGIQTFPAQHSGLHMNSDKIVINSNSPTNIYLNAEHADVTPVYRENLPAAGGRFGAPLMPPRPALVETTPAKRPGSGSSKHKKSHKNSSPSLTGSSAHWVAATTETPQANIYTSSPAVGGAVQAATTTFTTSQGGATYGGHEYRGAAPLMATSPLHVMTTGGTPVVTTTISTKGGSPMMMANTIPTTSVMGNTGTVSSHGTTATTTVTPAHASEVVTLQGSPMQAIYTRGTETGYTVERSHMSSVAEHSVVTSGIEGSPLARLSKEKETEQAMLKRLEAHYKAI